MEDVMLTKIRFVSPDIKKKYDLDLPEYEGIDQVVEVNTYGQKLQLKACSDERKETMDYEKNQPSIEN